MDDRKVAVLAGAATLASAAVRLGSQQAVSRFVARPVEAPVWLPAFGSVGETVTVYILAGSAVGPVVGWGVVLALGVYLGRRVDVRRDHRRLVRALATGSLGGSPWPLPPSLGWNL